MVETGQILQLSEQEADSVAGNPEFEFVVEVSVDKSEAIELQDSESYQLTDIEWTSDKLPKLLDRKNRHDLLSMADAIREIGGEIGTYDRKPELLDAIVTFAQRNGWTVKAAEEEEDKNPEGIAVDDFVWAKSNGIAMRVESINGATNEAFCIFRDADGIEDSDEFSLEFLTKVKPEGASDFEATPPKPTKFFTALDDKGIPLGVCTDLQQTDAIKGGAVSFVDITEEQYNESLKELEDAEEDDEEEDEQENEPDADRVNSAKTEASEEKGPTEGTENATVAKPNSDKTEPVTRKRKRKSEDATTDEK